MSFKIRAANIDGNWYILQVLDCGITVTIDPVDAERLIRDIRTELILIDEVETDQKERRQ